MDSEEPLQPERDEPRTISPFKLIRRGEDTVDDDDKISFADYRPSVVPSDTPESPRSSTPKEESALVPAPLPDSLVTTEQAILEKTVPHEDGIERVTSEGAVKEDGKKNPIVSSRPTSSSDLKPGPDAPSV